MMRRRQTGAIGRRAHALAFRSPAGDSSFPQGPHQPERDRRARRRRSFVPRASAAAQAGRLELYSTDNRNTPDGLANLPKDYTDLPRGAPKLGPPLPGDLGPPILNAGAPAPTMADREHERAAQEQEAALTSHLFATTNTGPVIPASFQAPTSGSPAAPTKPSGSDDLVSSGSQARVSERQCRSPHRELRSHRGSRRHLCAAGRFHHSGRTPDGPAFRPARPCHRTGDGGRLRYADREVSPDPTGRASARSDPMRKFLSASRERSWYGID